jgi:hypothetical protein
MGGSQIDKGDAVMNVDTGRIYTNEELHEFYTSHTTEQIRQFEKRMVKIEGEPEAIADLAAKVATSEDNLRSIQEEARQRVYRAMR